MPRLDLHGAQLLPVSCSHSPSMAQRCITDLAGPALGPDDSLRPPRFPAHLDDVGLARTTTIDRLGRPQPRLPSGRMSWVDGFSAATPSGERHLRARDRHHTARVPRPDARPRTPSPPSSPCRSPSGSIAGDRRVVSFSSTGCSNLLSATTQCATSNSSPARSRRRCLRACTSFWIRGRQVLPHPFADLTRPDLSIRDLFRG